VKTIEAVVEAPPGRRPIHTDGGWLDPGAG
jgi:hypothetical protein